MAEEDLVEVKFRLFDGSDIGPSKYDQSTTVASLKESILSRWPQDKEISPKTINDLKLINAGRILENNRTLAESRVSVGEFPGGVITMHVVVRPPQLDKNNVTVWALACAIMWTQWKCGEGSAYHILACEAAS